MSSPEGGAPAPRHLGMLLGLLIGAAAGLLAHVGVGDDPELAKWLSRIVRYVARPIGDVFLRLLFMLVLPLVVSALAVGVAGLGDLRQLGRIGFKTLAYTVVVSAVAVLIGVFLVELLQPGTTISPEARERLLASAAGRERSISAAPLPGDWAGLVTGLIPKNPIEAAATGNYLAVMVFAAFLGIGIAMTRSAASARLLGVLEGVYEVGMALVRLVLRLAPLGVGALLFAATAELGLDVLASLASYVGVVLAALLFHQLVVYSFTVRVLGGMSPLAFFRAVRVPMLTAFSTASSNATLPAALRAADVELRLPTHVSRFVLTLGSTMNQNGTALFEGVTVLFLAQIYGVELALEQQVTVVFMCILGGIGTAGVPAGSLPVVAAILVWAGIPVEGIGLVLGVDRFLDMCRTTLNVTGDLAAAVVVSRGEAPRDGDRDGDIEAP